MAILRKKGTLGSQWQSLINSPAELKKRDVSQIPKLRKNMSPTMEAMVLLVQSMKGVTKKTRVVNSVGKVTQRELCVTNDAEA